MKHAKSKPSQYLNMNIFILSVLEYIESTYRNADSCGSKKKFNKWDLFLYYLILLQTEYF